jgi:hypothetical protein
VSTSIKYRATANITLPIIAAFDDDGIRHIEIQAEAALQAETQALYCLVDPNISLQNLHLEYLATENNAVGQL